MKWFFKNSATKITKTVLLSELINKIWASFVSQKMQLNWNCIIWFAYKHIRTPVFNLFNESLITYVYINDILLNCKKNPEENEYAHSLFTKLQILQKSRTLLQTTISNSKTIAKLFCFFAHLCNMHTSVGIDAHCYFMCRKVLQKIT